MSGYFCLIKFTFITNSTSNLLAGLERYVNRYCMAWGKAIETLRCRKQCVTARLHEVKYTAKWTIWQVKYLTGAAMELGEMLHPLSIITRKECLLKRNIHKLDEMKNCELKIDEILDIDFFNGFSYDFVQVICIHCTSVGYCLTDISTDK